MELTGCSSFCHCSYYLITYWNWRWSIGCVIGSHLNQISGMSNIKSWAARKTVIVMMWRVDGARATSINTRESMTKMTPILFLSWEGGSHIPDWCLWEEQKAKSKLIRQEPVISWAVLETFYNFMGVRITTEEIHTVERIRGVIKLRPRCFHKALLPKLIHMEMISVG